MFNKEYAFNQCCRIHSVQLQSELQVELWVGAAQGKRLWTANPLDNMVIWGPARWSLRETTMTLDFGHLDCGCIKAQGFLCSGSLLRGKPCLTMWEWLSVAAKGPLPSLGAATVTARVAGSWMVRQKSFLHSQLKTGVWQIECLKSKAEVFQASLQFFFSTLKINYSFWITSGFVENSRRIKRLIYSQKTSRKIQRSIPQSRI